MMDLNYLKTGMVFEYNDEIFTKNEFRLSDINCKVRLLTLGRQLFATPGAPGAGSGCHFRLSSFILRDTEVIATNAFFSKIAGTIF